MGMKEPERSDKNNRREILLAQFFANDSIEGKIEPEQIMLESSLTGTALEA